jgi:hypothetical protein
VLDQDQNGRTLYVRGRDLEEKETAVVFAGGAWAVMGDAANVRRSGERNKIIAALSDHGEPMTPVELTAATGMPRLNVRQLLLKMAKAGEVHKAGGGRYWLQPVDNSGNSGNSGNANSSNDEDADKISNEINECHNGNSSNDDSGDEDAVIGPVIGANRAGNRSGDRMGET